MRREPPTEAELLLERAYVLQNMMKAQRQTIRKQEEEYKRILEQIKETGQARHGAYELVEKVQKRRSIVSDRFFKLWPQSFLKLARVSIKDAEAELGAEQLDASGVCEIHEQILNEVVSYRAPPIKRIGEE
jgi:hypothetical protein